MTHVDEQTPSEIFEEQSVRALDKKNDPDAFERALVFATLSVASAIREGVERLLAFDEEEDDEEDEEEDE